MSDDLSNPSAAQYVSQSQITGNGKVTTTSVSTAPATHSSGTLPFTGQDVGIVLVIAVLLIAVGVAMRRFSSLT